MNNLNLSEEQVMHAMLGDDVYGDPGTPDEDDVLFERVAEKVMSIDLEKASIHKDVIIKEVATGKFFRAQLGESLWHGQNEHNHQQQWREVEPTEVTITEYREV